MRCRTSLAAVTAAVATAFSPAWAGTYLFPRTTDVRRLTITRRYEIPVLKGEKNVAGIPALMSFWGATNEQVIQQSEFTYGLKPDKIDVTADNRGMLRRNYELTWNAPDAEAITVTQKLIVELTCRNTLVTAAKLPYPKEVGDRFAALMTATKAVNSEDPKVIEIGRLIAGKARYAEDAVELACAWVDDNIRFKRGSPTDSNTVLSAAEASCTGMSNLACAILRSIGIPAETVGGTFLGGGGHAYLEAYFPDAGWVFYDCSNSTRGFKSLDCLVTAGYCFRVQNASGFKWHKGDFIEGRDIVPYREADQLEEPCLRPWPTKKNVQGVRVIHRETPAKLKVRHWPISHLIMDLSIVPGKREYANPLGKTASGASEPKASEPTTVAAEAAVPPKPKPKPSTRPEESPAKKQLRVAKMYLNGGLTAKAEKMLRAIVKDFAESAEAAEARELLKGMEGSK
ncbi:MAG: transglutaminase family protein [Phycisphaerae bacterium]